MMTDPVTILGYARTPMGALNGVFAGTGAVALGAAAIRAAVARSGIDPGAVDQAVMGCVLPAGLGQAPARQAALAAGLPQSVTAATVNKMCGSGMQAPILGHDALLAGSADVVVTGGMESMTGAPYLLRKHRGGARAGHDVVQDAMFLDGLEDAYAPGRLMGAFAEDVARARGIGRAEQDAFALRSLQRARAADFTREIAAVGDVTRDEQPDRARPDKIPTLRPAFAPDGTITAANASSISDGAAALVLARAATAARLGALPVARVVGHAAHAHEPALFATAPVPAIRKLLDRIGWSVADVDLWEINEAFAVVTMIAMDDLGLDPERVNVNGGACALGHPIGASGARIVVTLLAALGARGLQRGIAAICIGGGEATAIAVERV